MLINVKVIIDAILLATVLLYVFIKRFRKLFTEITSVVINIKNKY